MEELEYDDIMDELSSEINRLMKETDSMLDERYALLKSVDGKQMTSDEMETVLARLQCIDAVLSVDYKLMSDMFAEMKNVSSAMMFEIDGGDDDEQKEGWIN